MVAPYRKFFLFLAVLALLLACSLPNFAALAPTPAIEEQEPLQDDLVDSENERIASEGNVQIPNAPSSISQQLPVQIADQDRHDLINVVSGRSYQLRQSVTLNHVPSGGENLIYTISAGGSLNLKMSEGTGLPNIISGRSGGGEYLFLPQAPSTPLQLQVDIETLPSESDHLLLTIEDLSQSRNVILQQSGFITEEILERAEVEATVGRVLVATMQPSPEFDGVIELYGPGGYILTLDDNGVGEAETLVYEPDQSGEWVFTLFGFQDSFGDYLLTVIELP